MLAATGIPEGPLTGWIVEPKMDGWRVGISVAGGRLAVRSRPGRDITDSVPELAGLAGCGVDVALDGELVAGAGRMTDFYGLSVTLAASPGRRRREQLRFLVFDLLWLDGVDLTGRSYGERRAVLEALGLDPAVASVVPTYPGPDVHHVVAACADHDLEGVVLKRRASTYRPGRRSPDWRKVKCPAWAGHAERRRLAGAG